MSGGRTGPLALDVQSGEWEAAAARTVDVPRLAVQKYPHRPTLAALPCLPEHQRHVPHDSSVASPVWAVGLKVARAFCSRKVSRSK